MKTQTKQPFNKRAFVTLMIAFAGLGLPVTGVANHVYQMDPMTAQRHAWMSAHNILGILFVVFCIWHIIFNRRSLFNYVSGPTARLSKVSREATYAVALVALALVAAVGHTLPGGQ